MINIQVSWYHSSYTILREKKVEGTKKQSNFKIVRLLIFFLRMCTEIYDLNKKYAFGAPRKSRKKCQIKLYKKN